MAEIEADVLAAFVAQLASDGAVPSSLAVSVGQLLAADKLPKADQLADLYTAAASEQAQ